MSDLLYKHYFEVVKPTWNYAKRLKEQQHHEQNALEGLASESGEALDIGKKNWWHTPAPDGRRPALCSELGDVIYYWLAAVVAHGFTIEDVLADNRTKLESRHPELGKVTTRFGVGAIK